jgi:hypothetical protein
MTANPAPRPALRRAPDADAHPARPWAGPANGSTLVARQALVAPTLSPATPTQRRAPGDVGLVPVTALPGRGAPAAGTAPGSSAPGVSGTGEQPGKAGKRGKAKNAADRAKAKPGKAPKAGRAAAPSAAVTALVAPPSATYPAATTVAGPEKAAKPGKGKRPKAKAGKGAASTPPPGRPVSPIETSTRRSEGQADESRRDAARPDRAGGTAKPGARVAATSPSEGARRRASVPAVAVVAPRRGADDLIGSTAATSGTSVLDAGTAAPSPAGSSSPRAGAPGVPSPTTVVLQVELPPALARRAEARATDLGYLLPDAVRELLTLWTEQ